MIGSIIGGVAALGSTIYGGIKSSQENKKAEQLIQKQRDENKQWYQAKMAEDYTMRSDAQAVINRQREIAKDLEKRAAARNAVAGGTDESLALQQEANNKALSETMSNIAANAASQKDAAEQQYRQNDAAIGQQQVQLHQAAAQATAQAAGQAAAAGINLMGQGMQNDFELKKLQMQK